jgi:PAS domain S-box-containing protein
MLEKTVGKVGPAIASSSVLRAKKNALRIKADILQSAIFNSVNFSSIATDCDGVIQIFNVGAERMLGFAATDVLNKLTPADISDPQELIARAKELSAELETPIAPGFEALVYKASRGIEDIYALTYIRKDGSRFPAALSVTALRDESEVIIGYLLIGTDNTAREQLEAERKRSQEALCFLKDDLENQVHLRTAELEVANRELEAFAYSISHDLRAPLRAIDGFSRKVVANYGAALGEEGRRLLQVVRDNAQKMGNLIDDLLAFSGIGRREIAAQALDMERMVKGVVDEIRAAEPQRAIAFAFSPLLNIRGDAAMIRQVWVNLLTNAVKFTRIRALAHIEIGGRIEGTDALYWVKDDGAGFDERYAEKLFGVFQRLHRQDEFEGTGVGLAIAQRIIQRHKGRIWGEGKPDAGATFFFALPLSHIPLPVGGKS